MPRLSSAARCVALLLASSAFPAMANAQTPSGLPPEMAQPTDPHTLAVSKEIAAAGRAFGVALKNRDYAEIERLWAPEMLVNSPGNSVLTRSQVIAAMKQNKLDYRDQHTVQESFLTVGDNAIQMGREDYVPLSGPEAGKRLYRRFTNFYLHRDGRWVLLARQATIYDPTAVHYIQSR